MKCLEHAALDPLASSMRIITVVSMFSNTRGGAK
jgi:hypothetical protein